MKRLTPIEGLRGYLAIWVLFSHVFLSTGYADNFGHLIGFLTNGPLAVKCFMIISGFVIFLLLDVKQESYKKFIIRRFLRIYPAYLLLFLISIPCSILWEKVFIHMHDLGWFSPVWVKIFNGDINSLWSHAQFHIPAHLLLLQGLVPESLLPGSPTAFLEPAWSLSLEWQFYLIAPLAFWLLTSKKISRRLLAFAACLLTLLLVRRFEIMPAALPFQIEYFFIGATCYFLYRFLTSIEIHSDWIFPSACLIVAAIFRATGKNIELFPFILWAIFFALLLEPTTSLSCRVFMPLFSNPISVWLGQISFSIYLSHAIVIIVVKWCLLTLLPNATQMQHLLLLAPLTLIFTVLVSAGLYYAVEAPFIRLGAKITGGKPKPIAVAGQQN